MTRGKFDTGVWQPWFAWRPVVLFKCFRVAWLRGISRRRVLTAQNSLVMEYTDTPEKYPRDPEQAEGDTMPLPPVSGFETDYRGYQLHQKILLVGWQIAVFRDDKFVRNGTIFKNPESAFAEARALVDALLS
jgi:hypothetical protein